MSALTGNTISSTYQSLLKIGTNNTASANLVNITDGSGNATVLSLSTTSASFAGTVVITGALNATASNAISASFASTATSSSFATTASNANFLDGLDSTAFTLLSGSNVMTGSITLAGRLSFNAGQGNFVLPSQTPPVPVVGSAYFSGSALYIYDGTTYLNVALS